MIRARIRDGFVQYGRETGENTGGRRSSGLNLSRVRIMTPHNRVREVVKHRRRRRRRTRRARKVRAPTASSYLLLGKAILRAPECPLHRHCSASHGRWMRAEDSPTAPQEMDVLLNSRPENREACTTLPGQSWRHRLTTSDVGKEDRREQKGERRRKREEDSAKVVSVRSVAEHAHTTAGCVSHCALCTWKYTEMRVAGIVS